MCPVCGERAFRSKNKDFTEGNQILAHTRGAKDDAHTQYRKGLFMATKKETVSL